jgi:hypothetical protein
MLDYNLTRYEIEEYFRSQWKDVFDFPNGEIFYSEVKVKIYTVILEYLKKKCPNLTIDNVDGLKSWLNDIFIPDFKKRVNLKIDGNSGPESIGNFFILNSKCPWLLQCIGEGFRKSIGEDIWASIADTRIREIIKQDEKTTITVPDVRYPNECQMLKQNGFHLWKLERKERVTDRDLNHPSETALNSFKEWDAIIKNDYTIDVLQNTIITLITTQFTEQ